MNKFFIITNELKDPDFAITEELVRTITESGREVLGRASGIASDNSLERKALLEVLPAQTECIIVLGGDGTLLRAARTLYSANIPFLGINIGHLGYLTEGNKSSAAEVLQKVFNDEYIIEERMLLNAKTVSKDGERSADHAGLNDVTISRNQSLHTIEFNLVVNGAQLYHYTADGIIISTPTGSTAYNLSCGGPIVEPTAQLFLITPIAPHSLNNRSLVLSAADSVEIEMLGSNTDDGTIEYVAYIDGDAKLGLKPGVKVLVSAGSGVARLVRLSKLSFLETLKEKMS